MVQSYAKIRIPFVYILLIHLTKLRILKALKTKKAVPDVVEQTFFLIYMKFVAILRGSCSGSPSASRCLAMALMRNAMLRLKTRIT